MYGKQICRNLAPVARSTCWGLNLARQADEVEYPSRRPTRNFDMARYGLNLRFHRAVQGYDRLSDF